MVLNWIICGAVSDPCLCNGCVHRRQTLLDHIRHTRWKGKISKGLRSQDIPNFVDIVRSLWYTLFSWYGLTSQLSRFIIFYPITLWVSKAAILFASRILIRKLSHYNPVFWIIAVFQAASFIVFLTLFFVPDNSPIVWTTCERRIIILFITSLNLLTVHSWISILTREKIYN